MENINTSFPNDGLGDKVRTAFIKVNGNFTELNNGKVGKIIGKGLSTNDYTDGDEALVASAVQPSDLAVVAFTGDYFDLDNQPTDFPPSPHTHVYTDLDLSVENDFEKAEFKLWKDTLNAFVELRNTDLVNGFVSKLRAGKNRIYLESNKTDFKGIVANAVFPKLEDPNAFAQLGDLQERYIPYTGTNSKLITGNFQVDSQQKTFFENSQYEFKYEINDTDLWVMILAIDKISGYKSQTTYELGNIQTVLTNVNGSTTFKYNVKTGIVGGGFYSKLNNANAFAQIGDIGTGWETYLDKALSPSNPLIIAEGDSETLTNAGNKTYIIEQPIGVTALYNPLTSKITPELLGDNYTVIATFKAFSTVALGQFEAYITTGLSNIQPHTTLLSRGIGIVQECRLIFDIEADEELMTNGGLIKINAISGDVAIYGVKFKIVRTHKAKVI